MPKFQFSSLSQLPYVSSLLTLSPFSPTLLPSLKSQVYIPVRKNPRPVHISDLCASMPPSTPHIRSQDRAQPVHHRPSIHPQRPNPRANDDSDSDDFKTTTRIGRAKAKMRKRKRLYKVNNDMNKMNKNPRENVNQSIRKRMNVSIIHRILCVCVKILPLRAIVIITSITTDPHRRTD